MKKILSLIPVMVLLTAFAVGCKEKAPAVESELDRAAKIIEKTPDEPTNAAVAAGTAMPQSAVQQQMTEAKQAYQTGDYQAALARLNALRTRGVRTGEELIAVQDATAAVMRELQKLAAQGDPRAQQAIKYFESTLNARP